MNGIFFGILSVETNSTRTNRSMKTRQELHLYVGGLVETLRLDTSTALNAPGGKSIWISIRECSGIIGVENDLPIFSFL